MAVKSGKGHALRGASERLPFDLRELEIFLAVADTRSMTAAATRLGLTQPAVSQVVRQLEVQTGVQLIVRRPRPLTLTVAGAMLHQRAAGVLDEARKILPAVREALTVKVPLVRIGIIDSLFSLVAPALGIELRNLVEQLSLWSGLTEAHNAAFARRSLDIVITQDPLEDVNGLERYPILREPYVLLLPGESQIRSTTDLAKLAQGLPLIRYTARSLTGKEIERYLRRQRLTIPMGQEFDDTAAVMAMVAAGFGWAITTPLCIIDAAAAGNRVVCVPLPGQSLTRQLTLVARVGELGRVPRRVAALAREVLEKRCFPEIRRMMPWLVGQFQI
jgi:DNA-binding transcriptional LysR family regulator